ncbi:translocation/assembly module TamB domain-containing protein [Synechococcus sp. HK01-R]|nr:translocation/assembly module TamB domain-containing protein [Synechococcus sp. HK01-R]
MRGGFLLLAGGGLTWIALDRIAAEVFDRVKPGLEAQLSKPLGHPLRIGAYKGLRPWGLAIGPSEVLPGPKDQSRASLTSLTVQIDPLASLRRWRPVATLSLRGARVELRRNAQGVYWVPGPSTGGAPPNLDLKVRLLDPARLAVQPAGLVLRASGRGTVHLAESWADLALGVTLPDQGRVSLKGRGRWVNPEFDLQTRLERVRLAPFEGVLPPGLPLRLRGQLGADLRLSWRQGRAGCQGGLTLVDFEVQGKPLPEPLRNPQWRLTCRGQRLFLPNSEWRYGSYRARLAGRVDLNRSFDLSASLREPGHDRNLKARLNGPWRQPRLQLAGRWALPESVPLADALDLTLALSADWRQAKAPTARLERLAVQGPGVAVRLSGALYPRLAIRSQQLQLAGEAWKQLPLVPELLGTQAPLNGSLALTGATQSPALSLQLEQARNPLLERWSLQADWSAARSALQLRDFQSPLLQAQATLPLALGRGGLKLGSLAAQLRLDAFPLARVGPILGTPMDGSLSAFGEVHGPLTALQPNLQLRLEDPRAGTLRLLETWQGRFEGVSGGGGRLRMASVGSVLPGSLEATLGRNWLPRRVLLTRRNGELVLDGTPAAYRWQARGLSLDGLELALPPKGRFEGLYGRLDGQGSVGLQPLAMAGDLTLRYPGLMGLQLRQARLQLQYDNRNYLVSGELLPPDSGQMLLKAKGRLGGGLAAELQARGLSMRWLTAGALSLPQLNEDLPPARGRASDLGTLLVNTFGGSLDGQLRALRESRETLQQQEQARRNDSSFHPEDLRGQVDAVIQLQGQSLAKLDLDLKARGHLWVEGDDQDRALQIKPFVATIQGPLQTGEGSFSLDHLPFSLLALVAPVPPALQGALGLKGRYRLGQGLPELSTNLELEDAKVGRYALNLERGQVILAAEGLRLDLALRSTGAQEAVTVTGQVPFAPDQPLDVRVVSRGDALRFLTGFTDDQIAWTAGDSNLRLLLSGSLSAPQANGFLLVNQGRFTLQKQVISDLNTEIVFDFNRLEVQSLKARIGAQGQLLGQGALALFSPSPEPKPLTLSLQKARIQLPIADVAVAADLKVSGALIQPQLSGDLTVDDGVVKPARSMFVKPVGADLGAVVSVGPPVSADTLLEENWNFQKPLVLLGPDVEASSSRSLRAALPSIPAVSFANFRLRLGPKLRVTVEPVASFSTAGLLTLNGALDPSLQLRGVVQLLSGRVSLFTTTFNLDRRSPNVAVFTPSLGLIPYVDVALNSRVSDSISVGTGSNAVSTNVFDTNGAGALGAGGQLRLVKVMLTASGPADRLADSIDLRSSPPMPKTQLLGLIGGNSLAGLSGAGGGAALAAVLGQSLLSPVIGSLTDAFSQRLQFALYPTYVTPEVQDNQERISGRVPPQLAVVTDLGVDITDRFNFSVLAAPNRNDIPPQGTLSYQINPNMSLSGSVDSQGTWQSQMQLFFRF